MRYQWLSNSLISMFWYCTCRCWNLFTSHFISSRQNSAMFVLELFKSYLMSKIFLKKEVIQSRVVVYFVQYRLSIVWFDYKNHPIVTQRSQKGFNLINQMRVLFNMMYEVTQVTSSNGVPQRFNYFKPDDI